MTVILLHVLPASVTLIRPATFFLDKAFNNLYLTHILQLIILPLTLKLDLHNLLPTFKWVTRIDFPPSTRTTQFNIGMQYRLIQCHTKGRQNTLPPPTFHLAVCTAQEEF